MVAYMPAVRTASRTGWQSVKEAWATRSLTSWRGCLRTYRTLPARLQGTVRHLYRPYHCWDEKGMLMTAIQYGAGETITAPIGDDMAL
jgi:hypothetical protein